MSRLLPENAGILNIGLSSFADTIRASGRKAIQLDWSPPAAGDSDLGMALAKLMGDPRVAAANEKAFNAYLAANPILVGVGTARDVMPDFEGRILTHSGPPITWEEMCGPMQGAITGACIYEGWASSLAEAEKLAASGAIRFAPCHHHSAVGPMTGVISPSMPVWIVENGGKRYFAHINEGFGKVLRFGANNEEVINRLLWMRDVLGPSMARILALHGPIEMKQLMAQALHMGDEIHNRNVAASGHFFKLLVPALIDSDLPQQHKSSVARFMCNNAITFLNLSMVCCKAMTDAAHGIPGSSMVTVMARNGVKFGIRLSGTGDRWFQDDAMAVKGLYFSGYSDEDANPDLGDSAITETAGFGAFAMAAAPAIVQLVGGTSADAIANTETMRNIVLGVNNAFTLPACNFAGTPAGIDARAVLDTSLIPIINTGVAHRLAGVGQIGAGITHAPLGCFIEGIKALAASLD